MQACVLEVFNRKGKSITPRASRRGGTKELMQRLKEAMERVDRPRSQPVVRWEDFFLKFESHTLGLPQDFSAEAEARPAEWFSEATRRASQHVMTNEESLLLARKVKAWFSSKKNEDKVQALLDFLRSYKSGSDSMGGKYLAVGPWVVWRIVSLRSWYEKMREKEPANTKWQQPWQDALTPCWVWDPKWISEPRLRGMFREQMMAAFQARAGLVIWPFAAREAFHLYMQYVAESQDSDVPQDLWDAQYKARMQVLLDEAKHDSVVIKKRLRTYRQASRLEAWISSNPIQELKLYGIGQCHIAAPLSDKQAEARAEVLRKRHALLNIQRALGSEPEIKIPGANPHNYRKKKTFGRKPKADHAPRRVVEGKPRARPTPPPESPVVYRSPPSKVVEPKPKREALPEFTSEPELTQVSSTVVKRKKV